MGGGEDKKRNKGVNVDITYHTDHVNMFSKLHELALHRYWIIDTDYWTLAIE